MFRYLLEYMWREQVRRSGADLFKSFLQLIAERQSVISAPEEIPMRNCLFYGMIISYNMLLFSVFLGVEFATLGLHVLWTTHV